MPHSEIFSGSYPPEDVCFLLKRVEVSFTSVQEKERLIQLGEKHYSDMLSEEPAPSEMHLSLYNDAMSTFGDRLAREVLALAKGLVAQIDARPIVLTSLVRAGVPLAVCLLHALREMGVAAEHYGVSIVRDRGLDMAAMAVIAQRHGTEGVVFIDGWVGKGAIYGELQRSLANFPQYTSPPRLAVLADPGGCAWLSSSGEDWLMPFGILGAPVSGLVSRSLWSDDGFHGTMFCEHLRSFDLSRHFVADVDKRRRAMTFPVSAASINEIQRRKLHNLSHSVIAHLAEKYQVDSINRIKPGIAEATRAVMRRVPEHILVTRKTDPDVALLIHLAEKLHIDVEEAGTALGAYRAVTIIKKLV